MSDLDRWLDTARNTLQQWKTQLARFAPGPAVSAEQLTSEDASTRWRAVRDLKGHPNAELLPRLVQLSDDPDEMVRAAVVETLASWGPAAVLEPVRLALAAHPTSASATVLLEILARLPDPANRAAVQPWLDDEDVDVRSAALMALAALCDDDDLPQLEKALADEDIRVQRAVMTTLCAPSAGPLAARAASAADPILKQRAVQAAPRIQRHLDAKRKAEERAQKKQAKQNQQAAESPAPRPASAAEPASVETGTEADQGRVEETPPAESGGE
jgi:HEAT repeat protein